MESTPTIDTVSLTIKDLDRSLDFYQNKLGFYLHNRNEKSADLGSADHAFLNLVENPAAKRYHGTVGLYHYAVLLHSRVELARMLMWLIESQTPLQGLSDHGVSEAIYLPDPDGNGIEIYRDRSRDKWPMMDDQLQMVTKPLDIDSLLAELGEVSQQVYGLPEGAFLGHIHLHVSDIAKAENFFVNVLGFDLIQRYGSTASFLSMNDYHHHVGVNTWNGADAVPLPADALGLRWIEKQLGRNDIQDHVEASAVDVVEHSRGILIKDPFGNGIVLK